MKVEIPPFPGYPKILGAQWLPKKTMTGLSLKFTEDLWNLKGTRTCVVVTDILQKGGQARLRAAIIPVPVRETVHAGGLLQGSQAHVSFRGRKPEPRAFSLDMVRLPRHS